MKKFNKLKKLVGALKKAPKISKSKRDISRYTCAKGDQGNTCQMD